MVADGSKGQTDMSYKGELQTLTNLSMRHQVCTGETCTCHTSHMTVLYRCYRVWLMVSHLIWLPSSGATEYDWWCHISWDCPLVVPQSNWWCYTSWLPSSGATEYDCWCHISHDCPLVVPQSMTDSVTSHVTAFSGVTEWLMVLHLMTAL